MSKQLDVAFREISMKPRGAIVFIREESDQLSYVYTGGARGLMINPILFLNRTRLLERNVVIFQDRYGACYQQGISPQLNTFEAFLDWQIAFRARLPHVRRLFCLGTSAGAYAALLFGRLLEAEEVWAFGPPTDIDQPSHQQMLGDLSVPRERRDLAQLLGSPNGKTIYNVYFNEGCAEDAAAAQRISHCDGVRLWPQPGKTHDVLSVMFENDRLATLLPEPT
jgi:hypothetical protein